MKDVGETGYWDDTASKKNLFITKIETNLFLSV